MINMKRHINSTCALALSCLCGVAQAGVGDGPRAYQVAPVGSNSISFIPMHQNSSFNVDGSPSEPAARIKADIFALSYTRVFDLAGKTAGVFLLAPWADITGDLIDTPKSGTDNGLADVVVGGVVGIIGAPAMSTKEYVKFKPGFSMGILGLLTLPVGKYNSDDLFNVGANRWAAKMGTVMTWFLGDGLLPGQVTSLELTPSVSIYGDNDDPRDANKLEQKPLYSVEAHVTHDFNEHFWGSIDALYVIGGSTITDGVKSDSDTEKFALGASVGAYLPHGFSLQFNYGKTLKVDTDGFNDHLVRIKLSKSF